MKTTTLSDAVKRVVARGIEGGCWERECEKDAVTWGKQKGDDISIVKAFVKAEYTKARKAGKNLHA